MLTLSSDDNEPVVDAKCGLGYKAAPAEPVVQPSAKELETYTFGLPAVQAKRKVVSPQALDVSLLAPSGIHCTACPTNPSLSSNMQARQSLVDLGRCIPLLLR